MSPSRLFLNGSKLPQARFFVSARRRRKFFTILDDQMHSELTKCRGFSMDLDLEIAKISPTGGLSAIPMIFHSPKSNPWQNNPWQSWYPKSNPWRHGCHGLSNPWRGNYAATDSGRPLDWFQNPVFFLVGSARWGGPFGGPVFLVYFYSILEIRDFCFGRENARQLKCLQKLKDTMLNIDNFAVKITWTRARHPPPPPEIGRSKLLRVPNDSV